MQCIATALGGDGDIQFSLRSVIHFFSSSTRCDRSSLLPSSPSDPPVRRDPPPHSKDGCEMRTNPLSVSPSPPTSPTRRRVIVARVQLFSFLVPLLRSSSELVQFSMVRVLSSFCKCNHACDEWSNLSCPSSPRPFGRVQYPK